VTKTFCPGTNLDARRAEDILRRAGRAIDADVRVGGNKHPLPLRLIGGHTPKASGFFLTNLPPRTSPRQLADLYRVRWEVELRISLDKSLHRLDEVDAARPCSLKTLLHAALIDSTIAALLAPTHHLQTRPPQAGAPRTEAPLHPGRLAWPLAVSYQSIAQAFALQGSEAMQCWDKIAALLTHSCKDRNWRRRPSVCLYLRWNGSAWKCGCQGMACTQSYWQLQKIEQ
jgi:hypothetical protein